MDEPRDPEASERLDALRRGLYRPDSTEADVRRYLDARDAVVEAAPAGDPAPPGRPRRRLLLVGAGAGLGLALVVALTVALGHPAPIRAASTPRLSVTPMGTSIVTDVGDGQTLTVGDGGVTSSVPTATSVRGKPVVGRLIEGRGNAVVPIDPPADPLRGGSAVVVISSASGAPVAWRALSRLRLGRAISEPLVLARGISAESPDAAVPQPFRYEAESWPARIAVAAPPGARWSLLLAVAGDEQTLH